MRILYICLVLIYLSSCEQNAPSNTWVKQKIDDQDEQILRLQKKVDSLQLQIDAMSFVSGNKQTSKKAPKSTYKASNLVSSYSGYCAAITKKGKQCSRKAKSNGYCWQHGG